MPNQYKLTTDPERIEGGLNGVYMLANIIVNSSAARFSETQ
jgi:hypothetical protein